MTHRAHVCFQSSRLKMISWLYCYLLISNMMRWYLTAVVFVVSWCCWSVESDRGRRLSNIFIVDGSFIFIFIIMLLWENKCIWCWLKSKVTIESVWLFMFTFCWCLLLFCFAMNPLNFAEITTSFQYKTFSSLSSVESSSVFSSLKWITNICSVKF